MPGLRAAIGSEEEIQVIEGAGREGFGGPERGLGRDLRASLAEDERVGPMGEALQISADDCAFDRNTRGQRGSDRRDRQAEDVGEAGGVLPRHEVAVEEARPMALQEGDGSAPPATSSTHPRAGPRPPGRARRIAR